MRSSFLLAALLGLACAAPDDSRERMVEEAGPVLRDVQRVIVATMHEETETPIDLEEGFSSSLTVGGFGGPDLSGGVGGPSLGGGVGGTDLGGGVGTLDLEGGGIATLPASGGGIDVSFVDAVCDLFHGVCQWVATCSEDPADAELCDAFLFGSQCHTVVTEILWYSGITAVPPQITTAIRCLADEWPTLGCTEQDFVPLYQQCVPGWVPPPDDGFQTGSLTQHL